MSLVSVAWSLIVLLTVHSAQGSWVRHAWHFAVQDAWICSLCHHSEVQFGYLSGVIDEGKDHWTVVAFHLT